MRERGIDTDIHYPVPDHRQPGLQSPARATDLRECERAADEILTLPCFPEMTDGEVDRVACAIAAFGGGGS
jgi:dTDP-4-amino-4,6-dideoxygalactose transaminase